MKSPPTRTTYRASTSAPTPNTADDEDAAPPSFRCSEISNGAYAPATSTMIGIQSA